MRFNDGWEYVYSSFNDAKGSYVCIAPIDGTINWKTFRVKR